MTQDKPMNEVASTDQKPRRWYNNYTFPLAPQFKIKKADEYNTKSFSFHWMFFKFWSLDSFQFEIAFTIDDHWGIGFNGLLPYLRWVIAIPCPPNLQSWVYRTLWRQVKKMIELQNPERSVATDVDSRNADDKQKTYKQ